MHLDTNYLFTVLEALDNFKTYQLIYRHSTTTKLELRCDTNKKQNPYTQLAHIMIDIHTKLATCRHNVCRNHWHDRQLNPNNILLITYYNRDREFSYDVTVAILGVTKQ